MLVLVLDLLGFCGETGIRLLRHDFVPLLRWRDIRVPEHEQEHEGAVLSPGEQQRLSFARLLLNHPQHAFLDEATSALDIPNERLMYELLSRRGHSVSELGASSHPAQIPSQYPATVGGSSVEGEPSSEFEPLGFVLFWPSPPAFLSK